MILKRTQFGNPILRKIARRLSVDEIKSDEIQRLIADMHETLIEKKLGVALAAPQVNESVALVVIAIRPLAHRQHTDPFDLVLINPEITETFGSREPMWEGCISSGPQKTSFLFGQVPRYKKVRVRYFDERGVRHHKTYDGLQAHIIQHETDHLQGVLFVDKVEDTTSYMTYAEYMKRARKVLADRAKQTGAES